MQLQININGTYHTIDTERGINISIPVRFGEDQVNAFYIDKASKKSFSAGGFVGNVAAGGSCNVEVIQITPHGNGTHTECVGHISKESYAITDCMKDPFQLATLISLQPETTGDDKVITEKQLREKLEGTAATNALIIRTLPNDAGKINAQYSGSNPAYFSAEALQYLRSKNVLHLVTDLPSVDREDDGGQLAAHHAWWNYPQDPRMNATITELVYVPEEVKDGSYLLLFSFSPLTSDASPSLLLLYPLG